MTLVDQINAVLPQTQCGQCGFKGCKPYAEAIAAQTADINQCPPGGETGIIELSGLLGIPAKPLNTKYGLYKAKQIAVIDEEACIGCVKCLAACPVDAIIGAAKLMHTVIAAECTGCELCVEPCPVDCITLEPLGLELTIEEVKAKKMTAMRRYAARNQRIATQEKDKKEKFRKLKEIHSLGKL